MCLLYEAHNCEPKYHCFFLFMNGVIVLVIEVIVVVVVLVEVVVVLVVMCRNLKTQYLIYRISSNIRTIRSICSLVLVYLYVAQIHVQTLDYMFAYSIIIRPKKIIQ